MCTFFYHLVFKVDVKMNQFVCKMEDSMFFFYVAI